MAETTAGPRAAWDAESRATWEVARRYHECWRARDARAALALFHPEVEYCDFYRNLTLTYADLPAYLAESMPDGGKESLQHTDRIRVDGDTAFIQYRYVIRLASSGKLASFQGGEAIRVRDGLIVSVHEYCTPVRLSGERAGDRIGLNPQRLARLLADLQAYFAEQRPYLDCELSLGQVAQATGYTRNQISHVLNQALGLSFYAWLNQQRVRHLLALPRPPAAPLDMAFAVGFKSASTFYKAFRLETGTTPQRYFFADS